MRTDELDARIGRLEPFENRREDVGRNSGRGAERELAGAAATDVGCEPPSFVDLLERALRVRKESPPCFRELDAAPRAHEHRRPELPLEALQPRGERRLGDEQGLGGAGDAAAASGFHECLELREEHL